MSHNFFLLNLGCSGTSTVEVQHDNVCKKTLENFKILKTAYLPVKKSQLNM